MIVATRSAVMLAIAGLLVLAGCGSDRESPAVSQQNAGTPTGEAATSTSTSGEQAPARTASSTARGTRIVAGDSPFGTMLFDSRKQAIYIFERDGDDETVCYGECAEAWPPVYTKGAPVAANGVEDSRLGTIERRDGRRQVTYAGKPLYYYAHEAPGEVRCHNVDLNGGLWWVIGPDGDRRP